MHKHFNGTWVEKELFIETGKLARQANSAVFMQYGDTTVLVAVVASDEEKEDIDFLPLFVDYREKSYAAGKIPGGFFKREGRPSTPETLTSRLIDRPIRPLFPDDYRRETQVYPNVLSYETETSCDILALNASSLALMISDVPFQGPIGAVRICHDGSRFIINPSLEVTEESILEIILAGTETEITMVEGTGKEASEELVLQALEEGHKEIRNIIAIQKDFAEGITRPEMDYKKEEPDKELFDKIREQAVPEILNCQGIADKMEYSRKINGILENLQETLEENYPEQEGRIKNYFQEVEKEVVRNYIAKNHIRPDGRKFDEIRPISCEVGLLPRAHGSSVFTRGQTQALATLTLGASSDAQRTDELEGEGTKRFMLHYNFPSFSVGEVSFPRGPGRREIGHGNLAENALDPILPDMDKFPYTIRIVSEILESNGSSSMASVCSGCLALMDGGVPISSPVAGIAMGLIKEGDDYFILSDIQGLEDHLGDMDFKIAGTENGITAIQMDIKIKGLPLEIMEKALHQANKGRKHILDKMEQTLDRPRHSISEYAPMIKVLTINPQKIGDVIGPGGKIIRKIIEETGATIDIQDDGSVYIYGENKESVAQAVEQIEDLTFQVEVGQVYTGKVVRMEKYGVFVEIRGGKSGLVHISEMDFRHVKSPEEICKLGDSMEVKVIGIDNQNRIKLSRKAAISDKNK